LPHANMPLCTLGEKALTAADCAPPPHPLPLILLPGRLQEPNRQHSVSNSEITHRCTAMGKSKEGWMLLRQTLKPYARHPLLAPHALISRPKYELQVTEIPRRTDIPLQHLSCQAPSNWGPWGVGHPCTALGQSSTPALASYKSSPLTL